MRQYTRAVRDYEAALRLDPKYARAHASLGDIYYQVKREYYTALAHYREAVEYDESDHRSAKRVRQLERSLGVPPRE